MALIAKYSTPDLRKPLFDGADPNGNGILSLAELDKLIVENPEFQKYNHKPVVMRAYKQCDTGAHEGLITRKEFARFLAYLDPCLEAWEMFDKTDLDDDRRIDQAEFIAGMAKKGCGEEEATKVFNEIDKNGGGKILFNEYYDYVCRKGIEGLEFEE